MPALKAALFRRDLEQLGALVRDAVAAKPHIREDAEKDWAQVRADVLHGQIDYRGDGPLPEHWKQFIDKEANLFDWRHPKWVMDAEKLLLDLVVKAAAVHGWQGEVRAGAKTPAGLVDLMMELSLASKEAKPYADKFLEGMPEWLQHDNAYTGGYLTEDDVGALWAALEPHRHDLEASLKAGPLVPGLMDGLARAREAKVGLTWTVPMLRA
jgi:hypothetical protein